VLEGVAKQWFRAVADGNEAQVAELLAADPISLICCLVLILKGSAPLTILRRSSLMVVMLLIQAAAALHFSWRLDKDTTK